MAVAEVDRWRGQLVRFAGVGNIAGVDPGPERAGQHMVSHNGTVGHGRRRIQEFSYPLADRRDCSIMPRDGLTTRWDLESYPGLAARTRP